ncbi:sugar-binding domain-containing protein [Parabacteroides sp. FAFU027]|uniref:sugar-binding domain-containing protein n=1 Tax=Parabacteroides sp. FAFU027 TaxID=2922715 RepID=UPI001FAFE22E|nr:sugar-binding domain-containing protein [Parabacteroides sp. FAFU027]
MIRHKKQLLTIVLFIAGCIGSNAQKQNISERKQLFDYNWKFNLGDAPDAGAINFNDTGWRKLDLPHDWSIEGKTDPRNPMSGAGGYFLAGTGWYRKQFNVPADWKGKRISIYFEGVYMNSEVFVNGKSVGVHPYGYTSFEYDLTSFVDYGKENVISVRVDNSQQINCRWYSGSGIYRHVWMYVNNPVHVANWGVAITSPEVSAQKATVEVKTLVKNETGKPQNIILNAELTGENRIKQALNPIHVQLEANSTKEITQIISVNKPLLWSPETPHLYQAKISVTLDGKIVDVLNKNFGIRLIQYSAEKGFQLNGKTIKINGGCVHHDNGCLGAAAYDRAEERKVQLLKAAGYNTVRTSHNPPSEAFLNYCDKLGLMVLDEAFDGWRVSKNSHDYSKVFDAWSQRDIESMVLRDRNHPSVIMWSIGNEIIERKKPEAVETAKRLAGYVRHIDPTRPVTSAMTTWDKDWEIFDSLMAAHDICGYNYQMHKAESDHQRVPSRVILQTESYPRDAFSNWNMVQTHNYITGDIVWTAMDYLGESGIGRYYYPGDPKGEHWERDFYPWHGAYCGDIDLTGWRKPISHYRNLLWNDTEKLYLAIREPNPDNGKISETLWSVWPTWESWTWPGREEKQIEVEIYSKYPKVRLYLNNKLVGEKQTTKAEEFKATFPVVYTAGVLKAVGVVGEKEVESKLLKTAGAPAAIKLTADRKEIKANGQDLSYVTVEVVDKYGILQPNADNRLQFTVTGPGVIAGADNADLKDTDNYVSNNRKTWHGRAMVVIKSIKNAGEIRLSIRGNGLSEASVIIKSLPVEL